MEKNTTVYVSLPRFDGEYAGEVASGIFNGEGKLTMGNITCEGLFKEGKPIGEVCIKKIIGTTVDAPLITIQNLLPNLEDAGDWTEYVGYINDYVASGPGTLSFASGLRYKGIFKQGFPEGTGKLQLPDGSYLEGSFDKNLDPQGQRTYKRFDQTRATLEILTTPSVGNCQFEVVSILQLTPAYELIISTERHESVIPFNRKLIQNLLDQIKEQKKPQKSRFASSRFRRSAFKKVNSKPGSNLGVCGRKKLSVSSRR
jgi:hypothetical protein